jgi:hypothetical protein
MPNVFNVGNVVNQLIWTRMRCNAPSDSIELIQDVAYDPQRSMELVWSPAILSQPGSQSYLQKLR